MVYLYGLFSLLAFANLHFYLHGAITASFIPYYLILKKKDKHFPQTKQF